MAEAGAGVLQPRSVELALAHGVDIHLRSSFSAEPGTWIRREAAGFETTGSAEVAGVAHRRQESIFAADGVGAGAVTAALAERGIAIGAVLPAASGIRFTAPGAEPAEVMAALETVAADGDGRAGARLGVGGQPRHRPQAGDPDARDRRPGGRRHPAAADHHDRRPGDRAGAVGAGRRGGAAAAPDLRPGRRGRRRPPTRWPPATPPDRRRRPRRPPTGVRRAVPSAGPPPTCPRSPAAGTSFGGGCPYPGRGVRPEARGRAPSIIGGSADRVMTSINSQHDPEEPP